MKDTIPVMEHFFTIQGEGAFSGNAAYFIRLGGCDVGCHWCDVKESWPTAGHTHISVDELAASVKKTNASIVVVTGGEPMMHDLTFLTQELKKENLRTHVETSGAHTLTGAWDWVCLSPKKFKEPLPVYYQEAHELKCIIFHPSDFEFAELNRNKLLSPNTLCYLQPEWNRKDEVMPLIVEYVKDNPAWKISLQTHKYLQIP